MRRIQVPDNKLRVEIRSLMAKHRIDMQRVQMRVFGGTVRMAGEVFHLGGQERPVSAGLLESFERDVVTTPGVRRAFFDFDNWRQIDQGRWEALRAKRRESLSLVGEEAPQPIELDEDAA